MKDVILIHEGVLLGEEIPADLLDPDRFDLRSVQLISEILPLAAALKPKAIILDLTQEELQKGPTLQNFLTNLHTSQIAKHTPLISVIGIIKPEARSQASDYYQWGVHALLNFPLKSPELQRELQDLLGTEFRRLDRKEIQLPLTLSQGENSWSVVSQNINLECIVVTGEPLPPVGQNVFLEGPSEPLSHCRLWAHCWRKGNNTMVLRFLNPELAFLESIQNLPKFQRSSMGPSPTPLAEENLFGESAETHVDPPSAEPAAIQNPGQLTSLDPEELKPYVQLWLQGEKQAPREIQTILEKLPELEKNILLQDDAEIDSISPEFAKIITLKIFLGVQLNGLLTNSTHLPEESNQIISEHEKGVDTASKEIQRLMTEALSQGNNVFAELLSQIKSELQKKTVSMRQTWNLKGKMAALKTAQNAGISFSSIPSSLSQQTDTPADQKGPTPYKQKEPPSAKKKTKGKETNFVQQALMVVLLFLLVVAFVALNIWQFNAPKRKISKLSHEEVQSLSPYFESGKKSKGENSRGMQIKMKEGWKELSEDRKNQEIMGMEAKLQTLNVDFAEIVGYDGKPMATYANGQITFFSQTKRN